MNNLKGDSNKIIRYIMIFIIFAIFNIYLSIPIIVLSQTKNKGSSLGEIFNMYQSFIPSFSLLIHNKNIFVKWFKLTLILYFIIIVFFSFVRKFSRIDLNGPNYKPENGTHGTAKWMQKNEAAEILDIKKGPIDGIVFGEIKNRKYELIDKKIKWYKKNYKKYSDEFLRKAVYFQSIIEGFEKIALPQNTEYNKNVAIYGASGSGKSRKYVRNQILQIAKMGQSMVITDPKGELTEDMFSFLKRMGYTVKVLNLVRMIHSDRWNPLKEVTDDISAQTFVETILANTKDPGAKTDFWDNTEMNLLKALVLLVINDYPEKDRNLASVYSLLSTKNAVYVDDLFDKLPNNHPAKMPYAIYSQASENVRTGVIIGLGTRLQIFQNEIVQKLTAESDIDLTMPKYKKTAFFCIISDSQSTFDFIAGLFFSFLFIKLMEYADFYPKKYQKEVYFLLDEFPNIGAIPDFTKKISTIRSRGINAFVIFQNIAQLENRYPNNAWSEILGNCDSQIFLGATDDMTGEQVSKHIGITTVENISTKRELDIEKIINSRSINEGSTKRYLLNPDEVLKLDSDELILMLRGKQPFMMYKMDYTEHELAKYLKKVPIRDYKLEWAKKYYQEEELKIKEMEENIKERFEEESSTENVFKEAYTRNNDLLKNLIYKIKDGLINIVKSNQIFHKKSESEHKVFYLTSSSSDNESKSEFKTEENNCDGADEDKIYKTFNADEYMETDIDEHDIQDIDPSTSEIREDDTLLKKNMQQKDRRTKAVSKKKRQSKENDSSQIDFFKDIENKDNNNSEDNMFYPGESNENEDNFWN